VKHKLFFYRGYLQAGFFVSLVFYAWFSPEHRLFHAVDAAADVIGVGAVVLGAIIRIWAVSHPGKHTRSRTLKAPSLVSTGPYGCVRNPIYLGNFLIGLGLVILAEAILWIPLYFIVFGFMYRRIVAEEEEFLANRFGAEFAGYCRNVPRWFPRAMSLRRVLTFGSNLHVKEFGTTSGVLFAVLFLEWIEAPVHRALLSSLYQTLLS
jgi:protein-S-isoprenylcysteine O-methyltransferase Ste14